MIPPHFDLSPIERGEDRLNLLLRLMKRKDVSGLVNACDAGREGELIFNYIAQHAKSGKPRLSPAQVDVLRRWIAEGAAWEPHWSYGPLARPPVPAVKDAASAG